MLKKRSRSKQTLMADTNQKQSKTTPFPRLFTAFKSFTENDAVASPTSTLDSKSFSVCKNAFGPECPRTHEPKRIGLAIVDSLIQEEPGLFSRPRSGSILFGSQLRIRVPDSPRSSSDFGTKTKNSPIAPQETKKTVSGSGQGSGRIFTGYFSTSGMEQSEDYTCVTCHGPNPRTIHIFGNCIVESQPGVVFFRSSDPVHESDCLPPDNFLSTCCNCKKNLGPRDDIFIFRGDRAFCSTECRSMEMMSEENDI